MSFAVSGMVEREVCIHCRGNLVIVHWILGLGQAELDELLRDDPLTKLSYLSALSFSQPGFEPVAFHPTVGAAVFFAKPAEKLAFTNEACL